VPFPLSTEISWHHVHPILVNFSAALVPASVASDLLGKLTRRVSLTYAGWWMLLYAAIVTPGTALAGWLWKKEIGDGLPAEIIQRHQWAGIALAVSFIAMAGWRLRIHMRGQRPGTIYFLLAFVVLAGLIYQGVLGGGLVFG
jgi:uncharacterized membrane protein